MDQNTSQKLTVAQLFGRSGKLLLVIASTVILGSGSGGTHGHIFPSGRYITVFKKLPTIQNPEPDGFSPRPSIIFI
jgi:hypothetical protein